jgi:hypothetical protein
MAPLAPFETLTLPKVVAVSLQVDLEPEQLRARTAGTLTLVNKSGRSLDTLYVDVPANARTMHVSLDSLSADRATRTLLTDSVYGVHVLSISPALAPGDTLHLRFVQRWASRAFPKRVLARAARHVPQSRRLPRTRLPDGERTLER